MDKAYEEKIRRTGEDRSHTDEQLMKRGSKVYKAFLEMERNAYADGSLDKRVKELIALGISIVINCESCMEWHIKQAVESGATEEQVLEAIEVGIEMGGGPATVASRFALKALEYHTGKR